MNDLEIIQEWFNANRLCLNLSKTHILGFKCNMAGLLLDGHPLPDTLVTKFLGVLIDGELRFESHILALGKKLSSGCFAIRIVREELGKQLARTVYFSVFESHLRYGIQFWGGSNQGLLNMLFILQKKAIRFIVGIKRRQSCRVHFVEQRILTLTSLFILETSSLIFKYRAELRGTGPLRATRQALLLPLPIPRSTLVRRSVIFEGRNTFNHLPSSLRTLNSLEVFRRSLKSLLISKAYYTMDEFYRDRL